LSEGVVKDLVVEQLKLLRGDVQKLGGGLEDLRRDTNARLDQTNARLDQTNARLEHLEVTLVARLDAVEGVVKDLAEQMVMLVRAVTVTVEHRRETDHAIDDLRRRVEALEAARAG
jgi:hypothetical protein